MNIKNVENLDFDVSEISEKINNELENKKEDILEVLTNEDYQITDYICMDREDGSIYTIWDCGNLHVEDVVLYAGNGGGFWHNCHDCPLNEDNIEEISEKINKNAEMMTPNQLKKVSKTFENWFGDVESDMNVEDLRHECFKEFVMLNDWNDFKQDMIQQLFEEYPETVEKIVANGGFQ